MKNSSMHPNRAARSAAPSAVPIDRRTRRRLRDLCDEVLASYRLAANSSPLTDEDRESARAVLSRMTPSLAR